MYMRLMFELSFPNSRATKVLANDGFYVRQNYDSFGSDVKNMD